MPDQEKFVTTVSETVFRAGISGEYALLAIPGDLLIRLLKPYVENHPDLHRQCKEQLQGEVKFLSAGFDVNHGVLLAISGPTCMNTYAGQELCRFEIPDGEG